MKLSELSLADLNQLSCYNEASVNYIPFGKPSREERDDRLKLIERNRRKINKAILDKIHNIDDFNNPYMNDMFKI